MKKLFVSADIEGTAGITLWDETENGHSRYPYFAEQMTREAGAVCETALRLGYDDVLIKDAHDSACNLIPSMLPEDVRIFRGWGSDPMSMVTGLDSSFDGVCFTGYHSAATMPTNPLSHTMNRQNVFVKINGEIASELMIHSYAASYVGVPVLLVTGDKGLCDWMKSVNPNVETVAVSEGCGRGSISLQPNKAVRLIREATERALGKNKADCMFPMPKHFCMEICFREHARAKSGSFYPGCVQTASNTVMYESDDYMDILKFVHWVL